jgi:hypothetical protein
MAINNEAGWRAALQWVDDIAALSERLVAAEVRRRIDAAWPRDTGYSAANNRVELGFAHDYPLDPAEKPEGEGSMLSLADAALNRDMQTLQQHIRPGIISIGNAVEYAADVGGVEGNGEAIYAEAGVSGADAGVRRVYQEWLRWEPPPR